MNPHLDTWCQKWDKDCRPGNSNRVSNSLCTIHLLNFAHLTVLSSTFTMDYSGVPAPTIDWSSSNLPEARDKFQKHVELMFSGPYKSRSEAEKCSYLLIRVGEKGRDIHSTWTELKDADKLATHYTNFRIMWRQNRTSFLQGTGSASRYRVSLRLLNSS